MSFDLKASPQPKPEQEKELQLSGEIAKVSLPNLLQLVKTGGFTGKLSLAQGVRSGTIIVKDGFPTNVELEGATGIDALMELFLWSSGTFSFNEEKVEDLKATIPAEYDLGEIIKDGMQYVEQTAFLEELDVQPDTILKPTGTAVSTAKFLQRGENINLLDGAKTLRVALSGLKLSRREYVRTVAEWLEHGLADFVEPPQNQSSSVNLPTWVMARLKQDNVDVAQAIVDMVIWVDRVKCWMYQTDAEFYETRKDLTAIIDLLKEKEFVSEGLLEEKSKIETKHFAPPHPPPETTPNQPSFDTIFNTTQLGSRKDNSGPFRLSSSFIGGAGGRLSFNQSQPLGTGQTLNNIGLGAAKEESRLNKPGKTEQDIESEPEPDKND